MAMEALRALPGVGEAAAGVILLRVLSWPDAFPHHDRRLRRRLEGATPAEALARAERWRPWRAYAATCLLQDPDRGEGR